MVCATGYADGTVVESESFPTTTPEETTATCAAWFKDKGIAALGIGAFGPTAVNPSSPRYGQILETPKTAWRYFDLLGNLQGPLGIPCGYDTDVNVACLGEVTFGCAQGLTDVVYLTIGTGVGAGVLSGGKLLHGMMHPEAGHIPLVPNPDDPIAGDGACPYTRTALKPHRRPGNRQALEWQEGQPDGGRSGSMDLLAGYLGQALATYILCYSPQRIIIGGGVGDHTPIVQLARAKTAEVLNNYIVTPEVANLDTYIVNNSLEGKQGVMAASSWPARR